MNKLLKIFKFAWEGKLPLAFAWWGIAFPLKILFTFLNSEWSKYHLFNNDKTIILAVFSMQISLLAIVSIIIWRCSKNVKEQMWTGIVKVLVVLSWLKLFFS